MSPRRRLEIADAVTLLGLLTLFEACIYGGHVRGWLLALVAISYVAAFVARGYVHRLARAKVREDERGA